jgi:hypothetical protein
MVLRELLKIREVPFLDTSNRDKHVRAGWIQLQCPFCNSSKWHLGYNEQLNYFNCYACGWHSVNRVLRELFPRDNIKKILSQLDVIVKPIEKNDNIMRRLVLPSNVGDLTIAHRRYLVERSLDADWLVSTYGIGGIGETYSKLKWRIFIPVYDKRGKVVTWTTRSINNQFPAYLSASKSDELLPIKTLLYGEHLVTYYDTVFIVEGIFDAWRIGSNALATFGKMITPIQKAKIAKYVKRVICFDNEFDTQEQAKRLCKELSLFAGTTVNVCLDAPDPAEATDTEIRRLRSIFL